MADPTNPVICPYCRRPATLVKGQEIYNTREDLWDQYFFCCQPCGARIGCHIGTTEPMGSMANNRLRQLRIRAHTALDPWWRGGLYTRTQVYEALSKKLKIPLAETHIALFGEAECLEIIKVAPTLFHR